MLVDSSVTVNYSQRGYVLELNILYRCRCVRSIASDVDTHIKHYWQLANMLASPITGVVLDFPPISIKYIDVISTGRKNYIRTTSHRVLLTTN